MGKVEITYKKKHNLTIIHNKIKFPEATQDRLCEVINAAVYSHLLPVKISHKSKKVSQLTCKVENLSSIKNFLLRPISDKEYFSIVLKIIEVLEECNSKMLKIDNLELRPETVFYEPNLESIKCVFWPIINNQSYKTPKEFFKKLIEIANLTNSNTSDNVREYNLFLNSLKPFSLTSFKNLVLTLRGQKISTKEISPSSAILSPSGKAKYLNNPKLSNTENTKGEHEYNPFTTLNQQYKSNQNSLSNKRDKGIFLVRQVNNEFVKITTKKFIIGSSKDTVNYYIKNSAISRIHCALLIEGHKIYIIDNNSTNKTYVNNHVIDPNTKVEIAHGTVIKLANEIFHLVIHL